VDRLLEARTYDLRYRHLTIAGGAIEVVEGFRGQSHMQRHRRIVDVGRRALARVFGRIVAVAPSWAVSHAEGRMTRSTRSSFTPTIYEFATHTASRARRNKPNVSADHPWQHGVKDYYTLQQLAKDRRAWARVQP
jgi:L-rhamnose isomerase